MLRLTKMLQNPKETQSEKNTPKSHLKKPATGDTKSLSPRSNLTPKSCHAQQGHVKQKPLRSFWLVTKQPSKKTFVKTTVEWYRTRPTRELHLDSCPPGTRGGSASACDERSGLRRQLSPSDMSLGLSWAALEGGGSSWPAQGTAGAGTEWLTHKSSLSYRKRLL